MTRQQIYERQRDAFTAAMERDGWTAVADVFGGVYAWVHSSDADWPVSDRLAFEHYIVTWQTPVAVRDVGDEGGELPF
jgi:aspartate/methionine/tyrosine aminotransferase